MVMKKYPVLCFILEKRQQGIRWISTRAKRIRKDDKYEYQIKGEPEKTIPMPFDSVLGINAVQGLKATDVILLHSPEKDQYHPMKLNLENDKLEIVPQKLLNWVADKFRKKWERFPYEQGALMTYMPVIMIFILLVGMLVFFVGMYQQVYQPMFEAARATTQPLVDVADRMMQMLEMLGVEPLVDPIPPPS